MVHADLKQKKQAAALDARLGVLKAGKALQSAVISAVENVKAAAPKIQKTSKAASPASPPLAPTSKAKAPSPKPKVKLEPQAEAKADVVVIDEEPEAEVKPKVEVKAEAVVKPEPDPEASVKPWERSAAIASRDADRQHRGKVQPVGAARKRPQQMAEPVDTAPPKVPRMKGSVAQAAASSSSAQLPSRFSAMAKIKRTAAKSMASRGPDVGKRGWGQTVFSF